jgi:predicted MFS family arabinose efflux permease
LLAVGLLDEFSSGMPTLGAPDIQAALGVSYALTAALLMVLPAVPALLLELPLMLLADRYPRRWFVVGGLVVTAACLVVAAMATSYWVLAAALGLWATASGIGVGLSQATLMDAHPDRREQMMSRWVLGGYAGDLLAPAVLGVLAAVGLGWRTGAVIGAGLTLVAAVALARRPFPEVRGDDDDAPVITLGQALRTPGLLGWLGAAALCDLMDETLVVLASIRLRHTLGEGALVQMIVIGCFVAGATLGLVVADRVLARSEPRRVLVASATVCALAYGAWLAIESPVASAALLFVVGAGAAPLYPITQAQAYRCMPGGSGTVNAAGYVFLVPELALALLLGWMADAVGVIAALAVLLVQPLGVLVIALWLTRRRAGTRAEP